jgi:tetratricopeptide (TPR) repeat protein
MVATQLLLALVVITSAAPSKTDGREEFERAARYYKAQEYEAALPWFQKAYELSGHRPSTIRGLAQCERSLKMYDEAIEHFREYLATNPSASEAKSVRKTIDLLEEMRATAPPKQPEPQPEPASEPRAQPEPQAEPQPQKQPEPEPDPPPTLVPQYTPRVAPPLTTQTQVEEESSALPWIAIGTGVAVTAVGATLFALGRKDISTVENAADGTPYRGDIEDAAGRAPAFTGLGLGLSIAGLTGTGVGIAWLIGQDGGGE